MIVGYLIYLLWFSQGLRSAVDGGGGDGDGRLAWLQKAVTPCTTYLYVGPWDFSKRKSFPITMMTPVIVLRQNP